MSVRKYFVDTNIFIRAIVKDDREKGKICEAWLKRLGNLEEVYITSSLVLAEIAWALLRAYKYDKHAVADAIRAILTIRNLKIADLYSPVAAADLYKVHNVKFADCLIASHPQILSGEIAVVSYDRDFDKLGVKRLEPAAVKYLEL